MYLKKFLTCILIAGVVCSGTLLPSTANAAENENSPQIEASILTSGGNRGSDYESSSKFVISDEDELRAFANLVNSGKDFSGKEVSLSNNIEIKSGQAWIPIGSSTSPTESETSHAFAGTFDGSGYSISGLFTTYNNGPIYNCGGLFGCVTGTVKNVILKETNFITAYADFGGIVGYLAPDGKVDNCEVNGSISGILWNDAPFGNTTGGIVGRSDGRISNCTSNCTLTNLTNDVGGIVGKMGYLSKGTVENCENNGNIQSNYSTGGIAGNVSNSDIIDCVNNGSITVIGTNMTGQIGGIAGHTVSNVSITNCTNTGDISADNFSQIGGIAGYLYDGSYIDDCNNSGTISGKEQVGGIAGYASSSTTRGYGVDSCENAGTVSGVSAIGGVVGSTSANHTSSDTTVTAVKNCINKASITGTQKVGGIVGDNNVKTLTNYNPSQVIGNINQGNVNAEKGGNIVGYNNNYPASSGSNENAGIIQNNFWPEELGAVAVGDGITAVANNSSYDSTTGELTTPISGTDGSSTTITTLGDALEALNSSGGSATVPDALKVIVSFDANGHGINPDPASQTVTMGKTVKLPVMSNDGYYTFLGWSDGTTTHQAGTEVAIMKNTTFTAQWRNDEPPYTGKYSYEISVAQPDNGSVAVDKYATEGETVNITATPDDGYMLDTLSVTAGGKELEVTDNGDGTYSFTMPSSKVSITAAFAEDPDWVEPEQPEEPGTTTVADIFSDVTPGAWYTDAVQYAYDNGLMTGTSVTTFEPNTTTTRGMIVSMLHRLEGSPAVGIADFSDVAGGDWYADPVAWAASEGIVGGYGDGTFGPNDPITREQMASILYRYADYKGLDVSARASLDAYSDADSVSPWASDVMSWAVSEGIISGMTEDTLAPQGTATRAQVAAMFQRFLENVMA